ncbi:hypothetical protein SDC9_113479 [bioreactor metagenome]|uniref:Uncharacterized protein n=1 Tax=bioreactor metagenome TaxID=1076179 RepID=A0A645BM61_9ZZZZ
MVIMWHLLSVLILLIIDANVVVFPLPVGPVTSISPLGSLDNSFTTGGIPNSFINGISRGIILRTIA